MTQNKTSTIIAISIVIIAAMGCAYFLNLNKTDEATSETTVTDALGRTVNIPQNVDSIFCMGACSLRLVSYFEAVEKVQAIETASTFNTRDDQTYYLINKERFSTLQQVATTAEAILDLNPNIIITSTAMDAATADTLQTQTGAPVYVINANLEFGPDFYDQVTSLGTVLGEQDRAVELNAGITDFLKEIESKTITTSVEKAYACGMFYYGGASFLKGSGNYLPFDYSKVTNVIEPASNGQPYVITLETLIDANPDYIFVDCVGLSGCIDSINDFIDTNTGLDNVTAVKNNDIYSTMVYKCYGTNWETQLVNVYYVASIMNGDLYTWDFEDKANEVIKLFHPETTMTYSDIADGQTGNGCGLVTR